MALSRLKTLLRLLATGALGFAVLLAVADKIGLGSGRFGYLQVVGLRTALVTGLLLLFSLWRTDRRPPERNPSMALGLTAGGFLAWAFWLRPLLLQQTLIGLSDRQTIVLWGANGLVLAATGLLLAWSFLEGRAAWKTAAGRRAWQLGQLRLLFQLFLGVILLETALSAVVPPWPARALRPIPIKTDAIPYLIGVGYNRWGTRGPDWTIQKPPGTARVLFVGDSFLEGILCRAPLPVTVEQRLLQADPAAHWECVNLGIAATSPKHYLRRIEQVGLRLHPDQVAIFIYAGNDLIRIQPAESRLFLIKEPPLPSLLGRLLPRSTWALIHLFRLSEFERDRPFPSKETARLQAIQALPEAGGIPQLAEHMHRHYFSDLPQETISDSLREIGPVIWARLGNPSEEKEPLRASPIRSILGGALAESSDGPTGPEMDQVLATADTLAQIDAFLRSKGIPVHFFLIPAAANVDPECALFYERLPNPGNRRAVHARFNANRRALGAELRRRGIPVLDLAGRLNGIPGTYWPLDGHWTEKGQQIAAEAVAEALAGPRFSEEDGVRPPE